MLGGKREQASKSFTAPPLYPQLSTVEAKLSQSVLKFSSALAFLVTSRARNSVRINELTI